MKGRFILECLAAWRLAYMLVHEVGPLGVFTRIRRNIGAEFTNDYGNPECDDKHPLFGMFCCTFCMSIWTAGLFARPFSVLRVLAVSAGALVVDRAVNS